MNAHAILLERIVEFFNLEELKTLCYNLRVDFDNLTGQGKEGKVRGLITYLERRGNLKTLISELAKLRPNVKWPSINTIDYEPSPQGIVPTEWIDTTYHFIGITGPPGSAFRLRMSHRNAAAVVMVSQLPQTGLSLMNVVDHVATNLLETFRLSARFLIFIEHYPPNYLHDGKETYELVQFNWDGKKFTEPRWRPISKEQAESFLGHSI